MDVDGVWKLVIPFVLASVACLACGGGGDDDETASPTSSPTATVLGADNGDPTDIVETDSCVEQTYEVQSGDTLSQIAERFGVTVVAIAGASRLDDPDFLEVGQELTIPCLDESPNDSSDEATPSPTPEQ